jgi:hypothetical protein
MSFKTPTKEKYKNIRGVHPLSLLERQLLVTHLKSRSLALDHAVRQGKVSIGSFK